MCQEVRDSKIDILIVWEYVGEQFSRQYGAQVLNTHAIWLSNSDSEFYSMQTTIEIQRVLMRWVFITITCLCKLFFLIRNNSLPMNKLEKVCCIHIMEYVIHFGSHSVNLCSCCIKRQIT